ncbi:protein MTO1 homolog, mitochondrial [Erpetoichthys calabaricus]|uniref:5-taurinomethyluridine-[tRNA] synthase subunit MTO1, mitochondrial n=1 Tax=Erpetoichthys calabaricus TaxID=27687 RepID=A0A8C4SMN7_ERPCA|nr:protein MTO1 homolog, mitochondrial [Erpetoichthys calabaricus]
MLPRRFCHCHRARLQFLSTRLIGQNGDQYDVIVVGGGHAGTEAAAAAARGGARTLLVTQKFSTIGTLSCNPSFGGIGKGHLVREVDALDGLCGRMCDQAGIHFKVLNRSKGPAVWGLRAQVDRIQYRSAMQREICATALLNVREASVEDLIVEDPDTSRPGLARVTGVRLGDGAILLGRAVILTTGTFLSGSLKFGTSSVPGGRLGEAPSVNLSRSLSELGFTKGRLKTGTPPRIRKASVNFDKLEAHQGDERPVPFSFMNAEVAIEPSQQLLCHLTYTTPGVENVVWDTLAVNDHVQQDTKGPRYCPSIESKVLRFPGRVHQVWLEPEGLNSELIYPQGLSMTMPVEAQVALLRHIPGLEAADIAAAGYGVQYDYLDPRQLHPTLETRKVQGLFMAGQINGTTGYEEAAAQGIVAGINAFLHTHSLPPFTISRTEGYIGVLIDDLTSLGVTEPYRMFTSRAEFRTTLRPDNADQRLTQRAYHQTGCISSARVVTARRITSRLSEGITLLKSLCLSSYRWKQLLPEVGISQERSGHMSAFDVLQYRGVTLDTLAVVFPQALAPLLDLSDRIQVAALYEPHTEQQKLDMEQVRRDEQLPLPVDLDYLHLPASLSIEAREVLDRHRPPTIAAATRLPGVTPAAIMHLLYFLRASGQQEEAGGPLVER